MFDITGHFPAVAVSALNHSHVYVLAQLLRRVQFVQNETNSDESRPGKNGLVPAKGAQKRSRPTASPGTAPPSPTHVARSSRRTQMTQTMQTRPAPAGQVNGASRGQLPEPRRVVSGRDTEG